MIIKASQRELFCLKGILEAYAQVSWLGAHIPGVTGLVTCATTQSAQSARWARTRTCWARSPPVAEMENRDSFLLLVPKLKEQVAPVS
jgi:hypothetical protein